MLSQRQEKLIKSLHTEKGRKKAKLWLVEGTKCLESAGPAVQLRFGPEDSRHFSYLTTTDTPPTIAGLAIAPQFQLSDVTAKKTILVLDHLQDPGNVGTIIRLAKAFNAGIILCECADPGNTKVIRSSAGSVFTTPWIIMSSQMVSEWLAETDFIIYRLENKKGAQELNVKSSKFLSTDQIIIIVGSEGHGIKLKVSGQAIAIRHEPSVDSLNVAAAVAIALFLRYQNNNKL